MQRLTDQRTNLWTAIVESINLRQLEACMFKTWHEKTVAVKRVSKSKRVHALADQLSAECARIAREQTWFQGSRLPRTELTKTLINAHVIAVHEYDHAEADDIEEYLFELSRMAEGLGA